MLGMLCSRPAPVQAFSRCHMCTQLLAIVTLIHYSSNNDTQVPLLPIRY